MHRDGEHPGLQTVSLPGTGGLNIESGRCRSVVGATAARRIRSVAALACLLALMPPVIQGAAARGHAGRRPGPLHRAGAPASIGAGRPSVGGDALELCGRSPVVWCGRLSVPLDHSRADSPTISVAFRWYPAADPLPGGPTGTIVPVEGGPGYPSTGSVESGYAPMYGPLLAHWNMLVVDNRGTGGSTVIDCPRLQHWRGATTTSEYQEVVAGCAESLNSRWRYRNGEAVHASDMFTTAAAAEDLAEVVALLHTGPVALYGDSYGSWFAQVFSSRYPQLVRSLVLDSTYRTVEVDPWYRSSVSSMHADFDAACRLWEPCAEAASGTAWEHLGAVVERLRRAPVTAFAPGPDGVRRLYTLTVTGMIDLISNAAFDLETYRELDAADRALLTEADPLPLLRLYAQQFAYDEPMPPREVAAADSQGLYYAVACVDYPQLFDLRAPIDVREAQLAQAAAALPASTFSPFTTAEWVGQSQNIESYTSCLRWPAPSAAQPTLEHGPPLLPASMPVLVLGGGLDTITPPVDHTAILAALGGRTRFIEVANATHVVGQADTPCGDSLVRRFVADPSALETLDASCATRNPPVHAVGIYPDTLGLLPPLQPSPANRANRASLRLAAAALETAADAVARSSSINSSADAGLHGGSTLAGQSGKRVELRGDKLIPGVPVSGVVVLTPAANPLDGSHATATLSSGEAQLKAVWDTAGSTSVALVTGTVHGVRLTGYAPAP